MTPRSVDRAGRRRPGDDDMLEVFALDDPSDRWLDVFRDARDDGQLPLTAIAGLEIMGEIGRGGQGVVYRARQLSTGTVVAIKRLRPGRGDVGEARRRLEREREAVSRLEHPAIVRPVCPTPPALEPAIIMEWVEGVPISEWARPAGAASRERSVTEILRLFLDVCDAGQHAHERGVIHRDLKPSNVLVERRGASGRAADMPRILDFGLASLAGPGSGADGAITTEGRLIGTPLYASPEQVAGRAADARADIYSLALLLHRCLAGELPFDQHGPLVDVLHRIVHDPARRASAANPRVGRDLDAVLLKALSKDPARRHQGVDSFRDDLLAVLENRAVSARLASRWYTARKAVARHRVAACATLGFVVLLTIGVVVSTLLAVRLDRERRQARAVAGFLQETLSSARPGHGGAGATVLEALAGAERRAETELADQPGVAIEVYQTIGDTYRSLWKFREAIPVLERAAELARTVHGDTSESLSRALSTLGHCIANTGDPRAVDLQREALRIRQARHRGDHRLVAESHMRLGYALHRAADPADPQGAEEHLRESLAMSKRLGDRLGAAQCLHNLGYLCWHLQRIPDALESYEEALTLLGEPQAGKSPSAEAHAYVECLTGYASLLGRADRTADAARAYERLIPILRRDFPEEALAPSLRRQARTYMLLEQYEQALPALEELLRIETNQRGAESAVVEAVRAEIEQVARAVKGKSISK